jgi:hypothetical protein
MPVLRADAGLETTCVDGSGLLRRPDLNDPPTTVGGILRDGSGLLR